MTDQVKGKAVAVFAGIYLVLMALILLAALYQAGQVGLLTPDWWPEFISSDQRGIHYAQ